MIVKVVIKKKQNREGKLGVAVLVGRWFLILTALLFVTLFLIVPLCVVFAQAFSKGWDAYLEAITDPDAVSAMKLTLLTALISVPMNLLFGLSAAWLISRFKFPFKQFLLTLIELPLAISPVVAGMMLVLMYSNTKGVFAPLLNHFDLKVIFAFPGIVLATIFVTLPYIARELIPLMQEQGSQEEEAALTMGASGMRTFFSVTLPNIKWGLLYGVILCNARAMGEFGAVSVVSGHIRGLTNTMPLQVEVLYNEYNATAAFAVASLLALLAVATIIIKSFIEWRYKRGSNR